MALTTVFLDTAAPVGSKLDPEMQAEIEELAPGIDAGEVGEVELADGAVTEDKLHEGAVTTTKIAEGGVEAINLAEGAVNEAAIAPDAVTAEKAGTGVCTAYDSAGNPVEDKKVYMTASEYSNLAVKDPNTEYHVS
jgi:hypothetical protein